MPIYEYRCQECREVSAFLVRSGGGAAAFTPACRACGSSAVARRMSTFALGKTTAGVHEAHPAGSPNRDYYRDPRNIGRNVEESFAKHGVAMPDSVRQSIDAARSGEAPQGIDL